MQVLLPGGDTLRVTAREPRLAAVKTLFLDADTIAMLDTIVDRLGGAGKRQPAQIMETPNQPIGPSLDILQLFNRFFAARPGHWGGWVFETYPILTQVEFLDAARTRAAATGHDWLLRGDGRPGEDERGVARDRPGRPVDHLVAHLQTDTDSAVHLCTKSNFQLR